MIQGHLVALVTPFRRGILDLKSLESMVLHQISSGVGGLVVLGTTGERAALSEQEQQAAIECVVSAAKERVPIIVNTGCNNTARSCLATKNAQALGADGCLAVVPYYVKPPLRGIIAHYQAISDVGLPVIAYHHPGRTGVRLDAHAWKEILSLPNLVGLKEASGDLELVKALSGYDVFCGDDCHLVEMIRAGCAGTISVVGNLIPKEWTELVDVCLNKQWAEAERLMGRMQPLLDALNMEVNPISVKAGLEVLGRCSDELRLPLVAAETNIKKALEKALRCHVLAASNDCS